MCCKLDTVATKNSLADLRGGCYRLSRSPLTCPAAPKSRTYQEGEVSHEKMRARTRLLQALHSEDPEAIRQARADAIKAGYSNAAVGAVGRTPSDVFLFSKLPEADQQAILRQANKDEFERYIGHAHMKLRKPPRSTLDPITATVPSSRIRRYRGVGCDHY